MIEAHWYRCEGSVWCELNKVDLEHELMKCSGVYIIWAGKSDRAFLRIGNGTINKELKKHKGDLALQAFEHLGLFVTWAEVSSFKRKAVHVYLAEQLNPKFDDNRPNGKGTEIELPEW